MSVSNSVKENPHCLVCNGRVGVSTRNSFQIFSKDTTTCSEKPFPQLMSQVLGTEIKEDTVHTLLICKKCFKLFDEADELEQRLSEIKLELVGSFKKSVQKNKNGGESEESAEKGESDLQSESAPSNSATSNSAASNISTTNASSANISNPTNSHSTNSNPTNSNTTNSNTTNSNTNNSNTNNSNTTNSNTTNSNIIISNITASNTITSNTITSNAITISNAATSNAGHSNLVVLHSSSSGKSVKLEHTDSNKENQVPKKILDIPSSDDDEDDTSQDVPKTFNTIEDIEMELEKIHGNSSGAANKNLPHPKEVSQDVLEDSNQEFHFSEDIVDAGAVDHSSDSDYEPPTSDGETLLHIASMTTTDEDGNVIVKLEPSGEAGDKPNILKRKASPNMKNKFVTKKIKEEYLPPVVSREGNLYTCLLCEGDETVYGEAKAIMLHVKAAHETRLYICDVCGEDFRKRNELSVHLDDHVAAEEGDFQCEICNRIFSNLRLFRIHKRMHYPQSKAWACQTCGKKYSSKNLLDEHMNTHTGARPYVCQKSNCGKAFASKYTFKAHEKTHEVRPRPFQCSQCSKSFLSQQNLTQHERTHSGIKEFQCHLCEKQFGSAHNLEVHSIVHTGYKPHVCGLCGKAFARKAEIRDHERTHTGERPYQCEFCGATFSQRSNLQSHKRATHYDDKRYKCEECGKGFKRRRLLDYHVKAAHTGERPFKCDVCEATFVYPEHFKKHRRIHTGEKPFCCEVCGKAFNSRDNRNAHRFVHSDKKPYECLVCGAGFMRKPLLFQHMQSLGHLNDTIVVNQPRLTTDDDQIITVNAEGEMEIVDGDISRLERINENEEDMNEDSKLYIAELKDHHMLVEGNEVFSDTKGIIVGEHMDEEQLEDSEAVEHIIIDGQQLQFAEDEDGEMEELEEDGEDGEHTQQVLTTEEYEGLITSEMLANGATQIIQTKDGPVQLVKVKIPNENGEEEETWLKIVQE